jgi:hypothetical protein
MNYFAEKLHGLTQKISGRTPQKATLNRFADSLESVQAPSAGPSRNMDQNRQLAELERMEREDAMRGRR